MLTSECYKSLIIFPRGLSHQGMGRREDWGEKEWLPQLWEGGNGSMAGASRIALLREGALGVGSWAFCPVFGCDPG